MGVEEALNYPYFGISVMLENIGLQAMECLILNKQDLVVQYYVTKDKQPC